MFVPVIDINQRPLMPTSPARARRWIESVEIGQVFGRWKVLDSVGTMRDHQRYLLCECMCGATKEVSKWRLTTGESKSCGCLRREISRSTRLGQPSPNQLPLGQSGLNRLYRTYEQNALKYNREFSLSKHTFRELVTSNCYYCGLIPSQEIDGFLYNGIDRSDNSLGYALYNCLPCCKICNRAKNNLSREIFEAWIERLRNHV